MNILPFGFPIGGAPGATLQLPPSGLGFAVALDGAQAGGMGLLDGLVSTPLPAQMRAAAPLAHGAQPGVLPAVPLSQLLTTAARIPGSTAPAMETPTGEATVPAVLQPTVTPAAEPASPGAAKPAAAVATPTTPNPPETPDAQPVLPAADAPQPVSGEATAGETPAVVKAEPQEPTEPSPEPAEAVLGAAPAATPLIVATPAATPIAAAAAAPIPQAPIAQHEAETSVGTPRKTAAARASAGVVGTPVDGNAAAPAEGFADVVAKLGDADGQQRAGADTGQQQQAMPQEAAKPAAGTQPATHFQPAPAGEAARPVSLAAAAAAAPTAHEPEVHAQPGHLGQSLGVEIARKIEAGEETLRVRLNPGELGRVEVTLNFDDRGSLQATMRTESAQALDLLRKDVPELARTLDQAGVRTDAQSFRFESRTGDGSGNQNGAQQQQRGQQHHAAAPQGDFETDDQPYRAIRGDGRVDLLA